MNEYQHKIKKARTEFPLKKTILLNPVIGMMVDEYGKELPESKLRNTIEIEKFLVKLECAYHHENSLLCLTPE